MTRWRSALFVPAVSHALVAKAAGCGADAIILDLEDGVASHAKAEARIAIGDHIERLAAYGAAVVVRVNAPWRAVFEDLDAAIRPGVTALMVPKAEEVGRLAILGEMLGEHERARDLPVGGIDLIALIESPKGLAQASSIAAAPRVAGLAFGTEDFALTLGVEPSAGMLAVPVQQMVLAAATREIMALAVPFSIADFRNEAGWRAATVEAKAIGATGALCVHPKQVAIANAVFAPAPDEIFRAKAIVSAWAERDVNAGDVIVVAGQMVDSPVVERARLLIRSDGNLSGEA